MTKKKTLEGYFHIVMLIIILMLLTPIVILVEILQRMKPQRMK